MQLICQLSTDVCLCLYVCRCLLQSVCLYNYIATYVSMCLYMLRLCLSVGLSVGVFVWGRPVCFHFSQSVCLCLSACLFACLCLSRSVSQSVCLLVCPNVVGRSVGRWSSSAVSQSRSARSVQTTERKMLKARERKAVHTRASGYAHKSDRLG